MRLFQLGIHMFSASYYFIKEELSPRKMLFSYSLGLTSKKKIEHIFFFLIKLEKLLKNWIKYVLTTILERLSLLFCPLVMSDSLQPIAYSMPGFPVLYHLLEFAQTYFHWVGDAIQPSCPVSSSSPSAFYLSRHQSLFQWVSSLHQLFTSVQLQLHHQFFQWIFRIDLL